MTRQTVEGAIGGAILAVVVVLGAMAYRVNTKVLQRIDTLEKQLEVPKAVLKEVQELRAEVQALEKGD